MKLTTFPRVARSLASTSFITVIRERPGQGQITSIDDATRANFKVHGAHPAFAFCRKERRDFSWTDFPQLQEGRVLTKQTGERERERERERGREREREIDAMCPLTTTFFLKVHQNGKA